MDFPGQDEDRQDDARRVALRTIAALDDDARRAVFDAVCRRDEPASRDDVAADLGISRRSAAFHLDLLAEQGLLSVAFRRLTGRTGPGAGRPSKLYARTDGEVAVSVPDRHYDLAGDVLASAVEISLADGVDVAEATARAATAAGRRIGREHADALSTLVAHGFEPRWSDDGDVVLANCPFHRLAQRHTDVVCGLNLHLVRGVIEGSADGRHVPRLDPGPGRCCVVLGPA